MCNVYAGSAYFNPLNTYICMKFCSYSLLTGLTGYSGSGIGGDKMVLCLF